MRGPGHAAAFANWHGAGVRARPGHEPGAHRCAARCAAAACAVLHACGAQWTCTDVAAATIHAGLASIGSGIAFGIPMPIQPMKTIVAQAIDGQISLNQALLAGAFVGAVMLGAGATGLVGVIDRAVPRSGACVQMADGHVRLLGLACVLRTTTEHQADTDVCHARPAPYSGAWRAAAGGLQAGHEGALGLRCTRACHAHTRPPCPALPRNIAPL